jgi:hypothetical protein
MYWQKVSKMLQTGPNCPVGVVFCVLKMIMTQYRLESNPVNLGMIASDQGTIQFLFYFTTTLKSGGDVVVRAEVVVAAWWKEDAEAVVVLINEDRSPDKI